MVKFDTTVEEAGVIRDIAERAVQYAAKHRLPIRTGEMPAHVEVEMDVTAVHCNGCKLRLRDFLAADDFNFAHDLFGIRRHLNRENGKLVGHFWPRFAARQ